MVGTEVSHYRMLEEIGSGGMGVVYKALDLRLDRIVALKFLSPSLTSDPESRKRFIREAKAASALQHQAICTIHEIDEAPDGRLFIVMDCYNGETLKRRLERDPLSLDEIIRIAEQLASGLAKAHDHGIVHCDIKPENVFLTDDGVVKILDFGLAKLVGRTLTRTNGVTQGTLAYMSPEQINGEHVGPETDIWSFGALLYEMLTRRLPFTADHAPAMMYAILNTDPPPLQSLRGDTPEHLASLCTHCLQKSPPARPPSMDAIVKRLRPPKREGRSHPLRRGVALALAAAMIGIVFYLLIVPPPNGQAERPPATLAILQFKNLTHDSATVEWSGVIQSLFVSSLTGVEGLRVYDPLGFNSLSIQRTEAGIFPVFGTESKHLPNVQFMFDGSILRIGQTYELHLNVSDARNQEILASLPCPLLSEAEIPRAVDELAISALEVIRRRTGSSEPPGHLQPWWPKRFTGIQAMKAFTRACQLSLEGNQRESEQALRLAVNLDSTFITPRVWLVTRLVWRGEDTAAKEQLRFLLARRDSVRPFERSIIDWAKACVEHDDSAQTTALNTALEYSPGNAILLYSLGRTKYLAGDYKGCVDVLRPVADQKWEYAPLYLLLGQADDVLEDYDAEHRALQASLAMEHHLPESHSFMATLYRRENRNTAAQSEDSAYAAEMKARGSSLRSIYTALSDLNIAEGFLDVGMAYYRRAVGNVRENRRDPLAMADSLYARGDTLHADVMVIRALALDSVNAAATFQVATILERTLKPEQALVYYRKYLTLDSTTPRVAAALARIAALQK